MIAGALDGLKTEIARRLIWPDRIETVEFLEHLATRLCLLRFLPGDVATNKLFRLCNQLLLVVVRPLLRLAALFTLDEVIGVVAGVVRSATIFELDDPAAAAIQKITVVTDDDVSRLILL